MCVPRIVALWFNWCVICFLKPSHKRYCITIIVFLLEKERDLMPHHVLALCASFSDL